MQNSKSPVTTPSLKRRLICLVYEAFLATAVAAFGILIFLLLTQRAVDPVVYYGRSVALFVVLGIYFIHSWTGSGHTLAMKTWRIKVVMLGHARVPFRAAALRYIFAWGWVLPALVISYRLQLSRPNIAIALGVGIVVWALTAFLDKDRQFLHDKLARTRLISLPKQVNNAK